MCGPPPRQTDFRKNAVGERRSGRKVIQQRVRQGAVRTIQVFITYTLVASGRTMAAGIMRVRDSSGERRRACIGRGADGHADEAGAATDIKRCAGAAGEPVVCAVPRVVDTLPTEPFRSQPLRGRSWQRSDHIRCTPPRFPCTTGTRAPAVHSRRRQPWAPRTAIPCTVYRRTRSGPKRRRRVRPSGGAALILKSAA